MKIGQLASTAHCTVETIRYYEQVGLLRPPERTTANYRYYGPEHVERLRFIRNCRMLDMTHEEIRGLLDLMEQPADSCGGVNQLLDRHIDHVNARIAELRQLKQQLTVLRAQCQTERVIATCGIVHGLMEMATDAAAPRQTHLG